MRSIQAIPIETPHHPAADAVPAVTADRPRRASAPPPRYTHLAAAAMPSPHVVTPAAPASPAESAAPPAGRALTPLEQQLTARNLELQHLLGLELIDSMGKDTHILLLQREAHLLRKELHASSGAFHMLAATHGLRPQAAADHGSACASPASSPRRPQVLSGSPPPSLQLSDDEMMVWALPIVPTEP